MNEKSGIVRELAHVPPVSVLRSMCISPSVMQAETAWDSMDRHERLFHIRNAKLKEFKEGLNNEHRYQH